MYGNLSASIHNRVSTLCQAYVKQYHKDIWEKLRAKAEDEYKNSTRRRTTNKDLEMALEIRLVKDENGLEEIKPVSKYHSTNYWGDPDIPIGSGEKQI